jgi:hypothetical protein
LGFRSASSPTTLLHRFGEPAVPDWLTYNHVKDFAPIILAAIPICAATVRGLWKRRERVDIELRPQEFVLPNILTSNISPCGEEAFSSEIKTTVAGKALSELKFCRNQLRTKITNSTKSVVEDCVLRIDTGFSFAEINCNSSFEAINNTKKEIKIATIRPRETVTINTWHDSIPQYKPLLISSLFFSARQHTRLIVKVVYNDQLNEYVSVTVSKVILNIILSQLYIWSTLLLLFFVAEYVRSFF